MKIKLIILGLFVFAFAFSSQAQTATPHIKKTQVKQHVKIKQGVQSGELTKREAVQLKQQQRHIKKTKRVAKQDGVIMKKERIKINSLQRRANANIYKKKHNTRARQ